MGSANLSTTAAGPLLAGVAARRPRYGAALDEVVASVWEQDVLDPSTLDLCRIRIGQLLGARPTPLFADAELSSSVAAWPTDDRFDGRLRIVLGYAEQMLFDAQQVTDDVAQKVIEAIGEAGFLVLTYACGLFETTQRAEMILGRERDRA
jgi:hypothetical protein